MESGQASNLFRYTAAGLIFVLITGSLAHFVYEWSGSNRFLGLFFPVNESTWEHMKLVFFPMLIYSLYMNHKLKNEYPCITTILMAGTILGTLLIPVIFYTYSGILGRNYMPLDIATFVISVIASFTAIYYLARRCPEAASSTSAASVIIVFIAAALFAGFVLFTYNPPSLGIFKEPVKITAGSS